MALSKRSSYKHTPESTTYLYQTIPERLEYFSRQNETNDAFLVYSPSGEKSSISRYDIYRRSVDFAKGLLEKGIQEGDVIGIALPQGLDWLISAFGVQIVGGIAFPFYFGRADGSDVISIMKYAGNCKAIVYNTGENWENHAVCQNFVNFSIAGPQISNVIPSLQFLICNKWMDDKLPRPKSVMTMLEVETCGKQNQTSSLPQLDPDDVALYLLTSGSTGIPKIVLKSHFSLIITGYHFCLSGDMNEEDIFYNPARFAFITGFPGPYLYKGITQVCSTRTIVSWTSRQELIQAIAHDIEVSRSTVSFIPVHCLQFMACDNIPSCQQWPIKTVITGGVPVLGSIVNLVGKIASKISNLYGNTELGMVSEYTFSTAHDWSAYNVGIPLPGIETKVVNDLGKTLNYVEVGEIFVRHHDGFRGYLNNMSQTEKVLSSNGWFKTDDLGYVGTNGYIYITGRKSDVIMIGGINVLPFDTEEAIHGHPDVDEVCVVAVEDEIMFQEQCACVVLKPGKVLEADDLVKFLSDKLATKQPSFFKLIVPKYVLFVNSLAKTLTHKMFRRKIAEMAREKVLSN